VLALDVRPLNNSLFRESPTSKGSKKWASFWMIWLQDMLAGWGFFL
jgi:hypothetical protein